jgi:hypothetical protein
MGRRCQGLGDKKMEGTVLILVAGTGQDVGDDRIS